MATTEQVSVIKHGDRFHNFRVVDVSKDGNCLFRAISLLEHGSEDDHNHLRQKACDWIQSNWEVMLPVLENSELYGKFNDMIEFVAHLRTPTIWGGDESISALASALDCNIDVWDTLGRKHRKSPELTGKKGRKRCYNILFVESSEHYMALCHK